MARQYPGVYAYEKGGQTLYRALFRDSTGKQRQKRGFTSPTAAAKFRAKMMEKADRGELRTSRERFSDWFDDWLRGHHRVGAGTRADYTRHGERRIKPFFGSMLLSTIGVQAVKDSSWKTFGRTRRSSPPMSSLHRSGQTAFRITYRSASPMSRSRKDDFDGLRVSGRRDTGESGARAGCDTRVPRIARKSPGRRPPPRVGEGHAPCRAAPRETET